MTQPSSVSFSLDQDIQRKSSMDIPIIQGTAVPAGGEGSTFERQKHDEGVWVSPEPRSGFQDVPWAILFLVHLVVMGVVIATNVMGNENAAVDFGDYSSLVWFVSILAAVSVGLATLSLGVLKAAPQFWIKLSLILTVIMSGIIAIMALLSGQMLMGLLGCAGFAVGCCYAKAVWVRIPYTAANLTTALTAVQANLGLILVAYKFLAVAFAWSLLWFAGVGQILSAEEVNLAVFFVLMLSFYWVHQVLTNLVHVTTAGTIGTWWFVPAEASSCCSRGLRDSVGRATTYSFGSICFGSLLVAIIQSLRALASATRDNRDTQLLSCIIDCILACIQEIVEYFNEWAYVYVGLYGFPYLEAGKNVLQLFQHKGWTALITDNLCDRVLLITSMGIGLLTGFLGWFVAAADPNILASIGIDDGAGGVGFLYVNEYGSRLSNSFLLVF